MLNEDKTINVYGRIKRIIDKDFINGQLWQTRFAMETPDLPLGQKEGDKTVYRESRRWHDCAKYFDFYGDIPEEFVGQEARYVFQQEECVDYSRDLADIILGQINVDPKDGHFWIENLENPNIRIPTTIRSQLLRTVKGQVIFPYEHLKKAQF